MGSIWVFFGNAYANAAGIGVGAVIITVLTSNGILEIILAAIVIPALVRALKPANGIADDMLTTTTFLASRCEN